MPNKNYFAQLSLKQKAELFNIYARGGYTSLSEIENHYNSLFNDDVEPVISIPESDNKDVLETIENDYNEQSFELPTLADYFSVSPNMFDMGGDKKYNIFDDKKSYGARDEHRESLDKFIKDNPELYGLKTADFADFLSQIAGLESSYKSDAGKGMTYSGYYGLKGGRDLDENAQHKAAFRHLKKLFNESIVKDDIDKGIELGYTPSQILAKYWNQGNRVTNYLWNNIDNTDGLGTKISDYGNNITVDMDYSNYLDDAITDDYIIINNSKSMSNAIKKARNPKMNYSDRQNYILNLNGTKDKNGKTIPLDATKVHVGDTLWLKK